MELNLSDQGFFDLYVNQKQWQPLQNHGISDKDIELHIDDIDFPYQIKTYLNLLKNIKTKDKLILDLGCGWGRGTHTIQKYYKESIVTGTDINKSFIDYAKSKYKNCKFKEDNIYKTNLKANSFDIILLNCSMHFFYDQDIVLQNIKKILKFSGKLIVTDLWTKSMFVIFLDKIKKNKLKILSIEDQTTDTIQGIKADIIDTYDKFKAIIDKNSLNAFKTIQKERLQFYEENINRHYKFIITHD
tara:strand:+ start:796 stop:1527 length:732 start_codon:yes stop_codon:yes gene_type:complete